MSSLVAEPCFCYLSLTSSIGKVNPWSNCSPVYGQQWPGPSWHFACESFACELRSVQCTLSPFTIMCMCTTYVYSVQYTRFKFEWLIQYDISRRFYDVFLRRLLREDKVPLKVSILFCAVESREKRRNSAQNLFFSLCFPFEGLHSNTPY